MLIYLDFDGTVVEHAYPKMGRCNYGCMEIIKKLQDAGHEIVLNTYRADCNDGTLEAALKVLNEQAWMFVKDRTNQDEFQLQPIKALSEKRYPMDFDMMEYIRTGILYIDDASTNVPLKPSVMVRGNMVDWDVLDALFIQFGVYKLKKTKFVVVNENTFAYVTEDNPNWASVMMSNILKGAASADINTVPLTETNHRLASEKDFEDYRISITGYKGNHTYIYLEQNNL